MTTGLALLQVKQTALPVELPLVAAELEAIDSRLGTAEQTLYWHHDGTIDACRALQMAAVGPGGTLPHLRAQNAIPLLGTHPLSRSPPPRSAWAASLAFSSQV